jgi:hypothetical protein
VESEGSWKQNAALMNKNRIRRTVEDKWAYDYEIQYPYRQATDVDSAGISGKVYCLTRGDLEAPHNPWASKDEKGGEKSADSIVGRKRRLKGRIYNQ